MKNNSYTGLEIAVIGMSFRFPGANNIEEFWETLSQGRENLVKTGKDKNPWLGNNSNFIDVAGDIKDKYKFDSQFFNYLPREARILDPQVRKLHECTWEALEHAGYNSFNYNGLIGLYAGISDNIDWKYNQLTIGNDVAEKFEIRNYLRESFTSLISYKLNLKGPSVTVQSACSTSLLAIHLSCQSLLAGECDMAIAGGATLLSTWEHGYSYKEELILSQDGHCRSFDKSSSGTIFTNGLGVVVLKRLEEAINDGDNIWAVIKGSATNNDGSDKAGYTAPSIDGQAKVIRLAQELSETESESITYIEAHGTGTPLGDLIEIEALKKAFGVHSKRHCAVGSVKANIGHLDCAAGIAGFIKTVLCLKNKMLVPNINFSVPNPEIDFENSPFYVNTEYKEWDSLDYPLRAGVSSLGIGGTNVHIVLEEPPVQEKMDVKQKAELILLSAKSNSALNEIKSNLFDYLDKNPLTRLGDLALTLALGRVHHSFKTTIIAEDVIQVKDYIKSELLESSPGLVSEFKNQNIVFVFPGFGSQYDRMVYDLYHDNKIVRDEMNKCMDILIHEHQIDLKKYILTDTPIKDILHEQLYLFTVEYALAKFLIQIGIEPSVMLGYCFGEYVAATLSNGINLNCTFDRLILRHKLVEGIQTTSHLSVPLSSEQITENLTAGLEIAINNGDSCVVVGKASEVELFHQTLKNKRVICTEIDNGLPFHSHLLEPVLEDYKEAIGNTNYYSLETNYISCLDANYVSDERISDFNYWIDLLRKPVNFRESINKILEYDNCTIIVVGPGNTLGALIKTAAKNKEVDIIGTLGDEHKNIGDSSYFLNALSKLWLRSININWVEFYKDAEGRRIPLPTYPFEGKTYKLHSTNNHVIKNESHVKKEISKWYYVRTWKSQIFREISLQKNILIFSDESELSNLMIQYLNSTYRDLNVIENKYINRLGHGERQEEEDTFNFKRQFEKLTKNCGLPDKIIFFNGFINNGFDINDINQLEKMILKKSLYFLEFIKALSENATDKTIDIVFVGNSTCSLLGNEEIDLLSSAELGLLKVVNQEYASINCKYLDLLKNDFKEPSEKLLHNLIKAINVTDYYDFVAVRNHQFWVKEYTPVNLQDPSGNRIKIKNDGVYLLLGGFGNIGFKFCKYILENYKAKVIVVTRNLNTEKVKRKLSELFKIVGKVGFKERIRLEEVNVNNLDKLRKAINKSKEDFGEINGLIYCVGNLSRVNETSLIDSVSEDSLREHYESKVFGLINLYHVFSNTQLDFSLILSSLSPILGGIGFGTYSMANQFIDSYIEKIKTEDNSKSFWTSVNWGDWESEEFTNDNTKVNLGSNENLIKEKEGIKTLEYVLSNNFDDQLIISSTDLNERIADWKISGEVNISKASIEKSELIRFELSEKYLEPKSSSEKGLERLWSDFLGYSKIGVNDNFFELGGDSLKAINLIHKIKDAFEVALTIRMFFNNPTIYLLSRYIDKLKESKQSTIKRTEKKEYYPVSSAQKRLFILANIDSNSIAYNITNVIEINGELDIERLGKAFDMVIAMHEIYRTEIKIINNEIVQILHEESNFKLDYEELQHSSLGKIINEFVRSFNFKKPPYLRAKIIGINKDKFYLALDQHHILTDGISVSNFIQELLHFYKFGNINVLQFQYKDFAYWQNTIRKCNCLDEQRTFWKKKLHSIKNYGIDLPYDFSRPVIQVFEGKKLYYEINGEPYRLINELAKGENKTLFVVLVSLFLIVLHKISGQKQVAIGIPVSGRDFPEFKKTIGIFINTLLLINDYNSKSSFKELLEQVEVNLLDAISNQDYQFEDLIEESNIPRDLSRNPLFDVLFIFQNAEYGLHGLYENEMDGLRFTPFEHDNHTSRFDLTLEFVEKDESLGLNIEYNTKLFYEKTVLSFVNFFLNIIPTVKGDMNIDLKHVQILSNREKENLLFEFNKTELAFNKNSYLHELILNRVKKQPDKIIIRDNHNCITYDELNKRANSLVYALYSKQIKQGSIIGVMGDRSTEMLIAIYAILKVGCIYLPLDPNFPDNRLKYIIEDSDIHHIIMMSESYLDREIFNKKTVIHNYEHLQSDSTKIKRTNDDILKNEGCYVMFTSGSTGKPKGILIKHANVINFMLGMNEGVGFSIVRGILSLTTMSFDISVLETLVPLAQGIEVNIPERLQVVKPVKLSEFIRTRLIDAIQLTPSRFRLLNENENFINSFKYVKRLLLGGEPLPSDLAKLILNKYHGDVYNMYGPTESTIWSTFFKLSPLGNCLIGKPISNTQVYILNEELQLQPPGIKGTIYIGGEGLSSGYVNNPELTHDKFIKSPFGNGKEIYNTGDLGKWMPDGNIEFLGRIDNQIKIQGYRIEINEIIHATKKVENINEVQVIQKNVNNNYILIAYYTATKKIDEDKIKKTLTKELPYYMVPKAFIYLKSFSYLPNGKLDLNQLPSFEDDTREYQEVISPRDELEKELLLLFKSLTGKKEVTIKDDFFIIGGDSLKAIQLINRIQSISKVNFELKDLFLYSTVEKLSQVIKEKTEHKLLTRDLNAKKIRI